MGSKTKQAYYQIGGFERTEVSSLPTQQVHMSLNTLEKVIYGILKEKVDLPDKNNVAGNKARRTVMGSI